MVLTDVTKELKWVQTLLPELGYLNSRSNSKSLTNVFFDNQSTITLVKNSVSHSYVKHIDLRHHFICEAIQNKIIWVQYIPTAEMTANGLTKALGYEKYKKCMTHMGMTT